MYSWCVYVLRFMIADAVGDVILVCVWRVWGVVDVVCAPTVVSTAVVLRVSVSMGLRLILCEHAK